MTDLFKPLFQVVFMMMLFLPVLAEGSDVSAESDFMLAEVSPNQQEMQNTEDTTQKVERFFWPATRWIEQTVRKTPLIRSPDTGQAKDPTDAVSGQLDLRTAIKRATRIYPGTVLNAEKVTDNGVISYNIRIISGQGVVRTIAVNGADRKEN